MLYRVTIDRTGKPRIAVTRNTFHRAKALLMRYFQEAVTNYERERVVMDGRITSNARELASARINEGGVAVLSWRLLVEIPRVEHFQGIKLLKVAE